MGKSAKLHLNFPFGHFGVILTCEVSKSMYLIWPIQWYTQKIIFDKFPKKYILGGFWSILRFFESQCTGGWGGGRQTHGQTDNHFINIYLYDMIPVSHSHRKF